MSKKVKPILIFGPPRSGTSWLAQAFDSHENTKMCFQPLFSYRFKDFISKDSDSKKIDLFFSKLLKTNDDFILQKDQKTRGVHLKYPKDYSTHLILKHVRYHNLITKFLDESNVKIIGIIRNPCGTINSWLKTPREFDENWPISEWRLGSLKNQGRVEEYYGYEKWKEIAHLFIRLEAEYSDRFTLIRYENLFSNKEKYIRDLFDFCDLKWSPQVGDFLNKSGKKEINDPDTIFRLSDVIYRWKKELNSEIINYINDDLKNTELKRFLED